MCDLFDARVLPAGLDREAVNKTFRKALGGEAGYETEYRVMLPNGRIRWIASRGTVEFNATGKPVLMRGAALDITSRKQAEGAARDLSGRLIQARKSSRCSSPATCTMT